MTMLHPGMPTEWALFIGLCILVLTIWALNAAPPGHIRPLALPLQKLPVIGPVFRRLLASTWPLLMLKLILVALFVLVIIAGLWGTPISERNIATTLTWNLWWAGIVVAIVFTGSAWCAVCPWDTIASWLVNHRLWHRSNSTTRLKLQVPRLLKSLWPATLLFIGLTWLELGVGIVSNPYATALLALLMVTLATVTLALFERKAFCRYICPVGRTVGVYSQLSPIALRSVDPEACKSCKTLDCFHGTELIAPCPTGQIMGRLQENTYCTSCGNCTQSCSIQNIGWQLRSPSSEAIQDARPHIDEAYFMLVLLALTSFHGLTMLPEWEMLMSLLAQQLNDSGQLLTSFSIGLAASLLIPIALYTLVIRLTLTLFNIEKTTRNLNKLFSGFAFSCLPLAFAYHLAHNLNHLLREGSNWSQLFANPLGIDTLPLSMLEKHQRHMDMLVSPQILFALQALLLAGGFWLSVQVIRHRGYRLFAVSGKQLLPLLLFAGAVTALNVWLVGQPMIMRM